MNVKLLQRIKKHILEEPRRLVMRTWVIRASEDRDNFTSDNYSTRVKFAKCNTAACIAGWACILSRRSTERAESNGKQLLDLDDSQAYRLFHCSAWIREFHDRYVKARTQKARAKIAAERIDHFIATNGDE